MPPGYVVTLMASRPQPAPDHRRDPQMRGMRDWRSAISAPLTYRIGSSTLHFRSHLLLVSCTVTAALLTIGYLALTGRQRSTSRDLGLASRDLGPASNLTHLPSAPVRLAGATKYRIAVVEDPDTASRAGQDHRWQSRLRRGYLTISDPPVRAAEVEWEEGEVILSSGLGAGGRGMELSELSVFHGELVTVDDRTGVVYRLVGEAAVPWVILADGDGARPKGLKAEWSTVREGELWVGGLGKEWTTPRGELASLDPMWVKVVGREGAVRHVDWSGQYRAVRAAAGVEWPGYMIHEAVCWSQHDRRWVFLPRRLSKDRYNDVTDERMGTNLMITADEAFADIKVSELGPLRPTRGFSSFKFVPGSADQLLVALKSEEVEGRTATYITVLATEGGKVLLPETKIDDAKFEGIEFV